MKTKMPEPEIITRKGKDRLRHSPNRGLSGDAGDVARHKKARKKNSPFAAVMRFPPTSEPRLHVSNPRRAPCGKGSQADHSRSPLQAGARDSNLGEDRRPERYRRFRIHLAGTPIHGELRIPPESFEPGRLFRQYAAHPGRKPSPADSSGDCPEPSRAHHSTLKRRIHKNPCPQARHRIPTARRH